MIGLIIAVIAFNFLAFKTNKRLNSIQIVCVWTFTLAFQNIFDLYIDNKYHGYWYFTSGVDWKGLPAHTILLPPVNMMFLNWFPYKSKMINRILYMCIFVVGILIYEIITLLPKPWGYFHYKWWSIWHSAIVDPILLLILLGYYKWICRLERNSFKSKINSY